MITFLHGELAHKGDSPTGGTYFVVDVHGVGYQVWTSRQSLLQSAPVGDKIKLYTSLQVREDAMQLVGFLTREERDLFDILGTASGVGFKVALSLMSELSVSELAASVMTGDFKRLTAAKGVGPKLAQKITIELKEKMQKWREEAISHGFSESALPTGTLAVPTQAAQEAETVLLSLGYSVQEVRQGLATLQSDPGRSEAMTSEEVLQFVLKWLATHPV